MLYCPYFSSSKPLRPASEYCNVQVYVDGPFGAGQQDWVNYDISVLVGGGIGVTPYASIIKDFAFLTSVKNTFRMKCHKVSLR